MSHHETPASAFPRLHRRLAAPPEAQRVLVVRLGALGDVARTLPAASALRAHYAHARFAWLVEPASEAMLRAQPWIDEVIVFPRAALSRSLARVRLARLASDAVAFVRDLRARRFDLVVDFHSIGRSGILAALSGAPVRVAYASPFGREGAWRLATHRARLAAPAAITRFARNEALVRFLGVGTAPEEPPLATPPEVRRRLAAALGDGPAPVAIHPGSSPATPYKRWSAAGYGRLARTLQDRLGLPSIVTAGPDGSERAFARAVVDASGGAARPAPETRDALELAALLSSCRLLVGGDSGPLHVAALVGTPVVQILGPTHPVENAPYPGTPARQVRVPVACSPCRRGCAAAHCMRVIPPDAVIDAALALLDATAPRHRVRGGAG